MPEPTYARQTEDEHLKRILQIGNWPPPVCGWSMSLVGLRRELESRGWDCQVMNLNENRKVRSPDYIDVQNGWDYLLKILRMSRRGYAVHVRVNGESRKGYFLALAALLTSRLHRQPALLSYCGGHQQSYFPAPKRPLRRFAFALLFRVATRIYCNSDAVRAAILTAGVNPGRVVPIPHFSSHYVHFAPAVFPVVVEEFFQSHDGVFFVFLRFRKEYMPAFLATVMRRFRADFPRIGFLLVGASERELQPLRAFLRTEKLEEATCLIGSVPHDLFLTMMQRSLACIRVPLTDGVCSSVLESVVLKIPVLATDNGTRPAGTELWKAGDADGLLHLMAKAVTQRDALIARMPAIIAENNVARLADDIEQVCLGSEYRSEAFAASGVSSSDARAND
jgi:glycosyltransferase involved in cell wall biosynthesis